MDVNVSYVSYNSTLAARFDIYELISEMFNIYI